MRKWAAYLLCFLSLALLGISGHFLADYAKQEEKADILQEQLKEIYENQKEETKEKPRQDEEEQNLIHEGLLALHEKNKDCIGWLTIPDTLIDYPRYVPSGRSELLSETGFFQRILCKWKLVSFRKLFPERLRQSDHLWTPHEQRKDVCRIGRVS